MPLRSRTVALLATAATAAGLLVAAAPAYASDYPSPPVSVQLRGVTSSSITAGAWHSAGALYYRLYASTVKADLYAYNISARRSTRHLGISSSPIVTVGGLPATSAPYYFRYATARHGHIRLSHDIYSTQLAPPTPTGFAAFSVPTGFFLTWRPVAAQGYRIYQSVDPTMRRDVRLWNISSPADTFTPWGLTPGVTTYFKIRSVNGGRLGVPSGAVGIKPTSAGQQGVRFATYNLLVRSSDGQMEGGQRIAPWSSRGPGAAALIKAANADVLAVQEGGALVNGTGPRQVDTLASMLGSDWTVASTERLVSTAAAHRVITGDYVVYRNDLYSAVGTGGYWDAAGEHVAAYQLLKSKVSKAIFLVVSMHLKVGQSAADDATRAVQMRTIVAAAHNYAFAHGTRGVIYGGDTNSLYARWHLNDTPGSVAYGARLSNANFVALTHTNSQYNSFNGNQRVAPKGLGSIDRIFAEPGTALLTWTLGMNVDRYGRFIGTIPSDHSPLFSIAAVPIQPYSS